jgi:hypothetical protein
MSVFASLVVGGDGSTSKGGNSREVSSGIDRTTFLERRRKADFLRALKLLNPRISPLYPGFFLWEM